MPSGNPGLSLTSQDPSGERVAEAQTMEQVHCVGGDEEVEGFGQVNFWSEKRMQRCDSLYENAVFEPYC